MAVRKDQRRRALLQLAYLSPGSIACAQSPFMERRLGSHWLLCSQPPISLLATSSFTISEFPGHLFCGLSCSPMRLPGFIFSQTHLDNVQNIAMIPSRISPHLPKNKMCSSGPTSGLYWRSQPWSCKLGWLGGLQG